MRSEHLRYLLEIDQCHMISLAAQNLYLSQTSLSAALKNIEGELGFSIPCRRAGHAGGGGGADAGGEDRPDV